MLVKQRSLIGLVLVSFLMMGQAASQHANSPATLRPNDPDSYLALTEFMIPSSATSADQHLAIQSALLGAWFALRDADVALAATCLIAATPFALPVDRAQLWDLAVMLDPTRMDTWRTFRVHMNEEREQAALAILFARYNARGLASTKYSHKSIRETIADSASRAGYTRGEVVGALVELARQAENDSCNGRIFVPRRDGQAKQIIRVVCEDHIRPVGALRNDAEFIMLLRTEMDLRNVQPTSWASGHSDTANLPLRDPSIEDLMSRFGVSPDRPYLRNGQWVASP